MITIEEYLEIDNSEGIDLLKKKYQELKKYVNPNDDDRKTELSSKVEDFKKIFEANSGSGKKADAECTQKDSSTSRVRECDKCFNEIHENILTEQQKEKPDIDFKSFLKSGFCILFAICGNTTYLECRYKRLEKAIDDFPNPTPFKENNAHLLSKLKSCIYDDSNQQNNDKEEKILKFLSPSTTKPKWTDALVFKFWRYIDLVILDTEINNRKIYPFDRFHFPNFIDSSFLALFNADNVIKTEKEKELRFLFAHFNGEVKIKGAIFQGKVNFNLATFHKKLAITNSRFEHEVYFRKTVFHNDANFAASNFSNISLNDIQFPKHKLYKIQMDRVTLEKAIWTEFNNPKNIMQLDANRETFSRFKQANAEIGNFIDSNLFFVAESESYRKESWKNFRGKGQEGDSSRQWSVLLDVISFEIAKWTSNYGTSWIRPIMWMLFLFVVSFFVFSQNKDYFATANTPYYVIDINKTKENNLAKISNRVNYNGKAVINEKNETIINLSATGIEQEYYYKNYYTDLNYDFQQENSKIFLKDEWLTQWSFYLSTIVPTFLPVEQQYIIKSDNALIYIARLLYSILLWYFITAFGFAISNRTRRS